MTTTMTRTDQPNQVSRPEQLEARPVYMPRFDIWEGENELLLFGDLPGVTPDNLDVRFEKRELTIHGKVAPRHQGEYLHNEYGIGDYRRTFTIGEAIDAENISAELHDGVLTIRLPKSEQAKPRRIEVKVD